MYFHTKNNTIVFLILCILGWLIWHPPQMAFANLHTTEQVGFPAQISQEFTRSASTNELTSRIGFGVTKGPVNLEASSVASLQAGFYGHWLVETAPYRPNNAIDPSDRVQCPYAEPYAFDYRTSQSAIIEAAQASPGSLWLLGNEIDRVGQDEMLPESYAQAYHELYGWIKEADPTARIANAGLVQPTPLRLEYLDRIWDTYQNLYGHEMPVDVWNIHNFILSEPFLQVSLPMKEWSTLRIWNMSISRFSNNRFEIFGPG